MAHVIMKPTCGRSTELVRSALTGVLALAWIGTLSVKKLNRPSSPVEDGDLSLPERRISAEHDPSNGAEPWIEKKNEPGFLDQRRPSARQSTSGSRCDNQQADHAATINKRITLPSYAASR